MICLVNSDNERDLNLLNSRASYTASWCFGVLGLARFVYFLEGPIVLNDRKLEAKTGLYALRWVGLHACYNDSFNELFSIPSAIAVGNL